MEENNPSDEEGEAMDDDQEEPSSSPGKNQKNPQGQGKKPHNKKDQWRFSTFHFHLTHPFFPFFALPN